MSTIRTVTETFIRKVKSDIHPDAVLVLPDDIFEVQSTPCITLHGPKLTENKLRRSQSLLIEKDVDNLSFEECSFPRLYHLDFDIVITAAREIDLLEFQETASRFIQRNPVLNIPDQGQLNLTELIPPGGLNRINLSNLKQSSGRIRIEDCPVYDGEIRNGKLIKDRLFRFQGIEEFIYKPKGD